MRIHIKNGHLVDPANQVDAKQDLYIADGLVVGVDKAPDGFKAEQVIDAKNKVVCPGLVDISTHLREPGFKYKGSIASETYAAAASGFTSVCMPPNTKPVIDTTAVVELIHSRAHNAANCRVYVMGALTKGLQGEHLSEMAALKKAGCVGVSNVYEPLASPQVLRRAMEYAASNDLTVFLYPEDNGLANNGCVHEGIVSTRLGLAGIPEAAETQAVSNYLMLVEQTGARVHFCRLSTARSVQLIGRAKYDGLDITADVCAHQLHLTEMDIGYFDSNCHVRPPVRTQRDSDALRQAVVDGSIEVIVSDHQPHDVDAKLAPFAETEPGISALESYLPLNLRLIGSNNISMSSLIERMSTTPAEILGIDAGHLSIGAKADICIFDPIQTWTYSPDKMVSQGHNTPFANWEFQGRVYMTLLDGSPVYIDSKKDNKK